MAVQFSVSKNLLLYGEIVIGKSTLIKRALENCTGEFGGFLTVRRQLPGGCPSFFLLPGQAMKNAALEEVGQAFLDLTDGVLLRNEVFASYGVRLLADTPSYPFALMDEFGGVELLVPAFRVALQAVLDSPVPCLGVFKTYRAGQTLAETLSLSEEYAQIYSEWKNRLEADPDTRLVPVLKKGDETAMAVIREWVSRYAE